MTTVCTIVQGVYDFDPRVRRKAEALVAAGYSVDVLALRPSSGRKTYTLDGVTVYTVALGKKRGSLARYAFEYVAFLLWAFVRVSVLMRRRRYAIVDVNTLPDLLVFAPVLARWMGAKIVLDMHEITPEFYMSKYGITETSRVIRLLTYLEKISFGFADHVIAINEPIQDLLVGRGLSRTKSTVIMNSANEAGFVPVAHASDAAAMKPSGSFVMMYHGTLTPIYGLDIAIEAFALAQHDMPGAELWILGSGTEDARLAALAEERAIASRVKLFGRVPAADIPSWLDKCDVGLLPIRRDVFLDYAFPNKLPEFIVMGKPVIMSRLKAIEHYFSEQALVYFEPNNPADLAKQMIGLFRDRDRRVQVVAEATRQYSPIRWGVMKQRYLRLVQDVAGIAPHQLQRSHAAEIAS